MCNSMPCKIHQITVSCSVHWTSLVRYQMRQPGCECSLQNFSCRLLDTSAKPDEHENGCITVVRVHLQGARFCEREEIWQLATRGAWLGDISESLLGHTNPTVDEWRRQRDSVCRLRGGTQEINWCGQHHWSAQRKVFITATKFSLLICQLEC